MMWESCHKVALDSNCFIYLLEGSPFAARLLDLFRLIEDGKLSAVTSTLTLIEVWTAPLKQDNDRLVEEYRSLIANFPNLRCRDVDGQVALLAACNRVRYGFKTPDAIQLAVAMAEQADAFVTNDAHFTRADFPVVLLGD